MTMTQLCLIVTSKVHCITEYETGEQLTVLPPSTLGCPNFASVQGGAAYVGANVYPRTPTRWSIAGWR